MVVRAALGTIDRVGLRIQAPCQSMVTPRIGLL
jgi:hypothetical protein